MPRQVDHDARRTAIADAVLHTAADRGFREVTVRAVAARVGASTSLVTHYVSGRDELIGLAVRREVETQQARITVLTADRDPRAALRAVVEWAVQGPDPEAHRTWLAILVGAMSEPVIRAEVDVFNRWWDGLLRDLAEALDPRPADPALLVDTLDVLIDGLVLAGLEDAGGWTRRRRMRVVEGVLGALGL